MSAYYPSTHSTTVLLASIVIFVIFFSSNRLLRSHCHKIVSSAIHKYLCWRYPICSTDGLQPIPTCSYSWPNGQGDVGKFLQGVENRALWEDKYGKIYRIWSGMNSEVVLTQPEHLRTVFGDSDKHSKAPNNNSGYLMSQILGQCVGLISTERWRSVRSVVEIPFLHKASTQHVLPIMSHTASYIQSLKDIGNLKDGLLDAVEDIKLLPFWIVARIIYGELSGEQIEELKALMPCRENLFRQVIRGGLSRFLWSKYLPSEVNSALAHFRARWAAFNEAAYSRAASYDKTLPIVGMFEAVKCGKLSLEQLYQTLDESLFANLDVTTGALSWNLVFLAANKKSQTLLLQEIHENIDNLQNYILSPSTYLAACINESSRLKPLAPFSVPQSAPTDRTIEGYTIPAGTSFVVDSYALNIHNDYWGPDRAVYRPERWSELKSKDLRYHFWRFGFGPRQCMGKYVADFMIRSLLVELLKEYDLGLLKDNGDWATNPESWILFPKLKLTVLKRAH